MRIGIDLGGTGIQGGVVDTKGQIIARASHRTDCDAKVVIADIIDICKQLADSTSGLLSIGIGCPGPVHPSSGTVVKMPNIKGFENLPLGDVVSKELGLPVYLSNDANSAALAEHTFGAAKNSKNSVTITLGTGIGSGIIINDGIYTGTFFGAGELGHQIINLNGEQCGCGQKGCWEAYASATALIRDASKTALWDKSEITAKMVFDKADAGDETAKKLINNYLNYLCAGLANVISVLQPEIIVIGGGISARGDKLLEEIAAYMSKYSPVGEMHTKISIAALGTDAGIIGAALAVYDMRCEGCR